MLWLLVSTLVLHQAVAMESVQEPIKEMSEINPTMTSDKVSRLIEQICINGIMHKL